MATVNYKGLTGKLDSVTVTLATTTIDQLITAIATDEGLPTEYYHVSLSTDPSKNDITYGDSSTKLDAMGFTDTCTVYCTPNQDGTREYRQIQKLEIAQKKRQADGDTSANYYRENNIYDVTNLPTKYSGNSVVDNANTGGLLEGRPWSSAVSIRSFLNAAGQTAYDNAASGAWFAVSSTNWNAAVAGVTGATKMLVTDGQMAESPGALFSSGYILTQAQAAATVTAGNYIFALRGQTATTGQTWRIYGGTTYKSSSYAIIGSATPSTASTGDYYYLRKAPTVLASTTYIGIVGSQNMTMTSSTFAGSAYIVTPYTGTWTNWSTATQPKVQVVTTTSAVV